jgi:hypothetical protein
LFFTAGGSSAPTPPLALDGISAEDLAQFGVKLTPPNSTSTGISRQDAERTALQVRPDLPKAKEVILAHLQDDHAVPPVDRDVWVVVSDTAGIPWSGGPYGGDASERPERIMKWSVTFIDAQSGELVFGLASGGPK